MAADWSDLPSELLQLISQQLDTELCLLRFRSVCSTWRFSSIPNHKHKNPLPLTLPLFPDTNSDLFKILNSKYCTSNLIKHTIFLIKPPQHQPSLNPWLIKIGPDFNGKLQLWHPFSFNQNLSSNFNNVLDFNKLSFRVLGCMSYFYIHHLVGGHQTFSSFCVAAVCRGEQRPVIVTRGDFTHCDITQRVIMFRCGDDSWTTIPNMSTSHGGNVCVFKGRSCVVDKTGRTMMIGSDFNVHLVADPFIGGDVKFLVESECQLFLVDSYDSDGDDDVRIDVFRLDEKDKKWVKLANLGDRVLFLGEGCSFSASASDLGFDNGNLVIYVNGKVSGCKMCVFQLDKGRASLLSDYPDYLKLFWPPPEWISRLHL